MLRVTDIQYWGSQVTVGAEVAERQRWGEGRGKLLQCVLSEEKDTIRQVSMGFSGSGLVQRTG